MNSRSKGHSFEREVAQQLRQVFPKARRHLEYHLEDCKGFDLDNTGIYRIQCKRGRNYAPVSKIQEVEIVNEDHVPVLITRGDRLEAMAVIPFDHFVSLLKEVSPK